MIKPLRHEEARTLLAESRIGRLGVIFEGGPYVVPVNFVCEGENVYVHSLEGRKLEALRANPRACLQVDKVIDPYHWSSAIAFGTYEEVTEANERDRALLTLLARFPRLTPVESVPVHDVPVRDVPVHNGQSSVVIFRIRIQEISGVGEK